jgi:uncharacterized membrane protein
MPLATLRNILRVLLALGFLAAAYFHLRDPGLLLPIMPDWVPFPYSVIIVTGLCEAAGAIALFTPLRRAAGIALALYAVCVYPANIKHALDNVPVDGVHLSWWYHAPRLLFQPMIVWWSLFAGTVIDWPFTARPRGRKSPHSS